MKSKSCTISVESKLPPTIEFDPSGPSFYIRFRKEPVAKTIERMADLMFVTIDLNKSGEVIGIEAVGADMASVRQILNAAKVDAPNVDFSEARIVPAGSLALQDA